MKGGDRVIGPRFFMSVMPTLSKLPVSKYIADSALSEARAPG
jgi:hypothetical protein